MKKIFIFSMLVVCNFLGICKVNAISYNDMEKKVSSNDAALLCEWNNGNKGVRLYRDFSNKAPDGIVYGLYYNGGNGYKEKATGYANEIIDIEETLSHSSINFYNPSNYKIITEEEGGFNYSLFICSRFARLLDVPGTNKTVIDMLNTTDYDAGTGVLYAFNNDSDTIYNKFVASAAKQFDKIVTIDSLKNIDSIENYIWTNISSEYKNATNISSLYNFFEYLRKNDYYTFSYTYINHNFKSEFYDFKNYMMGLINDSTSLSTAEKNNLVKKIEDFEKTLPRLDDDVEDPTGSGEKVEYFDTNCADFSPALRIGGYLLMLVKILVPLVIIIKASFKLASVAVSSNPEAFSKTVKSFCMNLVASIVIFLIPTILDIFFGLLNNYNANKTTDSEICTACIFKPYSDTCSSAVASVNK